MKVVESQDSYYTKQTVDRLNDLAAHAVQKVQSMPIENLYTEHPIFRINSKNLHIQFKEFDEGASLIRQGNYAYDALGRRIEKVVIDFQVPANNKTRRYVYDGEDIIKVFDESNNVISKYTHSSLRIDDALAIDDKINSKSYYFLKDHLGSIVDIVNEDLSFKNHYSYSSFGELQKVTDIGGNDVTANSNLEHHSAYTGREYDSESGLYHYRARAYDASTGRFLQVDPASGSLFSPIGIKNKFIYVGNNSLKNIDPSGRSFISFLTATYTKSFTVGISSLIAGVNTFNNVHDSGGSVAQAVGAGLSSSFFTGLGSAVAAVVSLYLPFLGDLITPFTSGGIAFAQNVTNQLIMNGGKVDEINWKRAKNSGVDAARIQFLANMTTVWTNWIPGAGAAVDSASAGMAIGCVDDGVTKMSNREIDRASKANVLDINCSINWTMD